MNEDEKKAIEIVKEIKDIRGMRQDVEGENEDLWALDTLINLINKQQKEIEKLKSKKYIFNAETNEIKEIPISDDYINKDKIRDIIFEFIPKSNHEAELRTKIVKLLGE